MIRRLFLLVLALVGIFWMLRRRRRPAPRAASGSQSAPQQDRMVRDRVCNKFLARSSAITLQVGSEEHFFCSEACRDRFLE